MARKMPKPFFKKSHDCWYVEINGKQRRLDKNREIAFRRYHELMLSDAPVRDDSPVCQVVDLYLDWVKANRAPRTYEHSLYWLYRWIDYLTEKYPNRNPKDDEYPSVLTVEDMRPLDLSRWADREFKKSENTKHTVIRTIKRCFSWARRMRLVKIDPTDGIEMPAKSPREVFITPDQWASVMKHAKGEEFRDLLTILKETGCRPFEAFTVSNKEFDRKNRRWVFARKNSKGKKYNRIQRLSDEALAICEKWSLRNPTGPIFRNSEGNPWTSYALQSRVTNLVKHLGFRLMPYAIRHTFATEGLANGVDAVVMAELMGHRDLTMVAKTYGHLAERKEDFLQESLGQALGKKKVKRGPSSVAIPG